MSNLARRTAAEVGALAKLEGARELLAAAQSLDEVRAVRDGAEAVRMLCGKARLSLEVQNEAAEVKLRAERRAGEMLAVAEIRDGRPNGDSVSPLQALGVARHESSRWQRIASIPEPDFDAHVAEAHRDRRELTTLATLRLAKHLTASDPQVRPPLHIVPSGESGLRGLDGTFAGIVADPPWQYDNKAARAAAAGHYPTLTVEQICDLDVADHATENAHLYLWTTTSFLPDAFRVLAAWGFTYKTNLVWVKPQLGIGNYFRVSHEHCLFGVRGKLTTSSNNIPSWFSARRGQHSRKPDRLTEIVEASTPGPWLEMFYRQGLLLRPGWTYWGNEA